VETEQAWRVPIARIQERNYNLDLKNPHVVTEDHGDPEELMAELQTAEQKAAALRDQLKTILAEALLR
jgi:type I restriction enzyme M protein